MIKKIFIALIIITLTSCDYEPIYSKKNSTNILIDKIELNGNKKIDRTISSALNLENSKIESGYTLIITSEKKLEIVSKDKTGNASAFKTTINVKILLNKDDEIFKEKSFGESFTYNNMKNKFELAEYQKNIEINLVNKISKEIFVFLNL
jgi:hypothetical protein|tara:strand:- start:3325 stop:3774 length:450 start_codon:yes stop_codon:yes gene_type:complete